MNFAGISVMMMVASLFGTLMYLDLHGKEDWRSWDLRSVFHATETMMNLLFLMVVGASVADVGVVLQMIAAKMGIR
jgi:hypothetical protein